MSLDDVQHIPSRILRVDMSQIAPVGFRCQFPNNLGPSPCTGNARVRVVHYQVRLPSPQLLLDLCLEKYGLRCGPGDTCPTTKRSQTCCEIARMTVLTTRIKADNVELSTYDRTQEIRSFPYHVHSASTWTTWIE